MMDILSTGGPIIAVDGLDIVAGIQTKNLDCGIGERAVGVAWILTIR